MIRVIGSTKCKLRKAVTKPTIQTLAMLCGRKFLHRKCNKTERERQEADIIFLLREIISILFKEHRFTII